MRTCDTTSSQSSSEVIANRRLRWRVLVALLERPAPYRRERQCTRGFWEVIARHFTEEMWIQTLRMAGSTLDESCDAGGPLVAPTTSGVSEPLPTDKQNLWLQVPPHASKIFVLVFFRYFLLTQFPICMGAFSICNLNLWNSGQIEMQLLFISHLILFVVLTGLCHFNL